MARRMALPFFVDSAMNFRVKRLFRDYLKLTEDKTAAANLVVADAIFTISSLSEPATASPPEPEPPPGDLSVAEAATKVGCSQRTIYRLCRDGGLPHYRVGVGRGVIRIRFTDLQQYQRACRTLSADISAKRRKYLGV